VERTQLQKAVDAAALAAGYDINVNSNSAADAVTYAKSNGVDPSTDSNTKIVTNQAVTAYGGDCTSGCPAWTVTAQRTVPLGFASALGISSGNVSATATAINSPVKSIDSSYLMPWGVWGGNNFGGSDPLGLNPGDLAVFRINDYEDANVKPAPCSGSKPPSPCNSNWTIDDNAFKGYFHDMTGTINQGGSDVESKGGNACGQEPTGLLDSLAASGQPGIFPVIGSANGGGGNNNFTVIGFVALKIHSTDCGGGQMDGYVLNWTTWQAKPGGTAVPGLPSVTVLKLWQ